MKELLFRSLELIVKCLLKLVVVLVVVFLAMGVITNYTAAPPKSSVSGFGLCAIGGLFLGYITYAIILIWRMVKDINSLLNISIKQSILIKRESVPSDITTQSSTDSNDSEDLSEDTAITVDSQSVSDQIHLKKKILSSGTRIAVVCSLISGIAGFFILNLFTLILSIVVFFIVRHIYVLVKVSNAKCSLCGAELSVTFTEREERILSELQQQREWNDSITMIEIWTEKNYEISDIYTCRSCNGKQAVKTYRTEKVGKCSGAKCDCGSVAPYSHTEKDFLSSIPKIREQVTGRIASGMREGKDVVSIQTWTEEKYQITKIYSCSSCDREYALTSYKTVKADMHCGTNYR